MLVCLFLPEGRHRCLLVTFDLFRCCCYSRAGFTLWFFCLRMMRWAQPDQMIPNKQFRVFDAATFCGVTSEKRKSVWLLLQTENIYLIGRQQSSRPMRTVYEFLFHNLLKLHTNCVCDSERCIRLHQQQQLVVVWVSRKDVVMCVRSSDLLTVRSCHMFKEFIWSCVCASLKPFIMDYSVFNQSNVNSKSLCID